MKTKRVQRPRLEKRNFYELSASVALGVVGGNIKIERHDLEGNYISTLIISNKSDARRLHKFLGRAISYLEAQKAGR